MKTPLFCLLSLFMLAFSASAADFHEEFERDYAIRSFGRLNVSNLRGPITVQGWALDRVRVKARKKVVTETQEQAKQLFSAVDFRYRMVDGDIELAAEYGKGLSIEDRLKERAQPKTAMEMVVFAPLNLKLRVWGADSSVAIKNWNGPVEVRTGAGAIHVDSVKTDSLSVLCPACEVSLTGIRGPVRCMGGAGDVRIQDADGASIYAETTSGKLGLARVRGEQQLYVTRAGAISGKELEGHVEFHSQSGAIDLEAAGFLSGRTESGAVNVVMKKWEFADKALIETQDGNIQLQLPLTFSGEVDFWSTRGITDVEFPLERSKQRIAQSVAPGRVLGRVGGGGELLKVFSERGNIRIVRRGVR